eukprot:3115699-Pyramimonas_sp.AAC.1
MERFEKIKTLGRGSQGSVILVRRKADDSHFVIKRIFADEQSPETREEIMNEIRVLALLAHPNIVGMISLRSFAPCRSRFCFSVR